MNTLLVKKGLKALKMLQQSVFLVLRFEAISCLLGTVWLLVGCFQKHGECTRSSATLNPDERYMK